MLVRPRRMAQLLSCSVDTLRRYRQDGVLTSKSVFKGRRLVRYDPDQVRQELDARFGVVARIEADGVTIVHQKNAAPTISV